MSAIDDVVSSLQAVLDELSDAANAANTAKSAAEEGLNLAIAAGGGATVSGYNVIKDTIDNLAQQIAAAIDIANEAITQANAVADGT